MREQGYRAVAKRKKGQEELRDTEQRCRAVTKSKRREEELKEKGCRAVA